MLFFKFTHWVHTVENKHNKTVSKQAKQKRQHDFVVIISALFVLNYFAHLYERVVPKISCTVASIC